jgi:CheY-like chemotaxis protein
MADVRVLVVDDTHINLKVIERMLNGIGVGVVRVADSGRSALSILQGESFALVITDIQMPEMDGVQLSSAILSDESIPIKPVVVGLTAETSDTIQERCSKAGMSTLLHKPITTKQLQSFISDLFHLHL